MFCLSISEEDINVLHPHLILKWINNELTSIVSLNILPHFSCVLDIPKPMKHKNVQAQHNLNSLETRCLIPSQWTIYTHYGQSCARLNIQAQHNLEFNQDALDEFCARLLLTDSKPIDNLHPLPPSMNFSQY